jgi:hypothetical protein
LDKSSGGTEKFVAAGQGDFTDQGKGAVGLTARVYVSALLITQKLS